MAKSRNHLLNKAETISKYDGKVGDILKNIIKSTVFFVDDGTPSYEGHTHDDRYYTAAFIDANFYTKSFIDSNVFTAGHVTTHFAPFIHTHNSTQITDFSEAVDDRIGALIQNGTGISWSYNDVLNTYTPTITLSPFSTSNLIEGSNLYYTDTRSRAAQSSSATGLTYSSGTGVLSLTAGYIIPTTSFLSSITWYDGWISSPGYNANTIGDNKNGFTYANNAPYEGQLIHYGSAGYGMQFNADYRFGGKDIAFRTRNGDTSSWNSWRRLWSDYDFSTLNINNWNVSFSWGNHATVGCLLVSSAASTYLPLSGGTLSGNLITNSTLTFKALLDGADSFDIRPIAASANFLLKNFRGAGTSSIQFNSNGSTIINEGGGAIVTHGAIFTGESFIVGGSARVNGTGRFTNQLQVGVGGLSGLLAVRGTTDNSSFYAFEAANSYGNSLFLVRNDGQSFVYGKLMIEGISEVSRINSTSDTLYNAYQANGADVGYIGNGKGLVSGGSATSFGIRAESDLIFAIANITKMSIANSGATAINAMANSSWGLTVENLGTTNAHGLYVNIGASSTGVPFWVDKNGVGLFRVYNNGRIITANASDTGEHFIIGSTARVNGKLSIGGALSFNNTYTYTTGDTMIGRHASNMLVYTSGATSDQGHLFANNLGQSILDLFYDRTARFYNNLTIDGKVVALTGSSGGFYNAGYATGFNNIWQFLNAPNYGIGYKQGATGWYGGDTIRFDVSNQLSNISGAADFEVGPNIAWVNGNMIWHQGNDGPGSGLDADLLDGFHASHFYPASNPNGYINSAPTYGVAYGMVSFRGSGIASVTTSLSDVAAANSAGGAMDDFTLDSGGLKYTGSDTIVVAIECAATLIDSTLGSGNFIHLAIGVGGTTIADSEQQMWCTTEPFSVTCVCVVSINPGQLITLQAASNSGSGNVELRFLTITAHKVS